MPPSIKLSGRKLKRRTPMIRYARVFGVCLVSLGVLLLDSRITIRAAETTGAPKPFVPTTKYATTRVAGWTVRVNRELLTTQSELGSNALAPVSYTHLRAHETPEHLVCR